MKRVVSGIRATGQLHLGNFFGAIRNFIPLQEENTCFFFVADYHTLTTAPDPESLRKHRLPIVKTFLATGIDPTKAVIYYQSAVPEIAELQLILGMYVTVAELQRCTTFKDVSKKHADNINLGLLSYPVLMAADILIHKAHRVPVGHDQLQHIEMTRDFARRFNRKFKEIFPIPSAVEHEAIRLPGLDGQKMGKSDDNTIDLLDSREAVRDKVKKGLTDAQRLKVDDPGDPENRCASIYPLHAILTDPVSQIKHLCTTGKLSCGECKEDLWPKVYRAIEPIQAAYHAIKDEDALDVLSEGQKKAKQSAQSTLEEVRELVGLD
jgi:tryptophanyl-tRNA synthetase